MFIILLHDNLQSTNQNVILQTKCWDYMFLQIYTVPEVWLRLGTKTTENTFWL